MYSVSLTVVTPLSVTEIMALKIQSLRLLENSTFWMNLLTYHLPFTLSSSRPPWVHYGRAFSKGNSSRPVPVDVGWGKDDVKRSAEALHLRAVLRLRDQNKRSGLTLI